MARKIEIQENLLDKAIAQIAPEWALKRRQARIGLALTGGYTGGRKDRRQTHGFNPALNDADSDILPDLDTLRTRSRDLVRNNALAAGAINTKVTNVVGTGLKLQSRINREFLKLTDEQADAWQRHVEAEFNLWASSQFCDIERTSTFNALQDLVFRSVLENGDAFILLPMTEIKGFPYYTRVQLLEADRVSNPDRKADTEKLAGGVEKDQYGAPTAYWVMTRHPGEKLSFVREWKKVPAFASNGRRNVIHLFHKLRQGQSRGVPDLAPVIELLKQLGDYTECEVTAAVVSSIFTVFTKTSDAQGLAPMDPKETGSKPGDKDVKMGPGAIIDLAPGEDVTFANPNRPNTAFDGFVTSVLRQIGVALELPFEILIKHFTASYSASRAAMLEAWRFFNRKRDWLAENFCQVVYEAWLEEAVALGRVNAPGFLTGDLAYRKAWSGAKWVGPARGMIDELKEVKAAKERAVMGLSTLQEETAMLTGGDWEANCRQRGKENKLLQEHGLTLDPKGEVLPPPANQGDSQNVPSQ